MNTILSKSGLAWVFSSHRGKNGSQEERYGEFKSVLRLPRFIYSSYQVITPTFHFKILEQFVEVFDKHSAIFVKNLAKFKGQDFDVFPQVGLCALDIICGELKNRGLSKAVDCKDKIVNFSTSTKRNLDGRRN